MEVSGELHVPAAYTHVIAGLVDPKSGLDVIERKIILYSYWEFNPDSSVVQPVA
jgi:hypothetical protein